MHIEQVIHSMESRAAVLTSASDRIWDFAETAFVEYKSAELLCSILEQESFEVERGIAGIETAFTGTYGSGKPVIGILGEYDALFNLNQEANVTVRQAFDEGKPGHGCGHNLLGVGSLGAALAVKDYLQKTGQSGTVIYYGCPGEEGGSGKAFMAREGVFDCLDAAFCWHPSSANAIMRNSFLSNIQVAFKYKGISAHAAGDPYNGRSALDAVELLNIGVQFLREHMIPEARIHYAITNTGGFSPNVVQPYAEVLYLIRAPKNNATKELYERVVKVAQGAAMMTETELEIDIFKACSNVVNNKFLEYLVAKNLSLVPMPEYTEEELDFAQAIMNTCPHSKPLVNDYLDCSPEAIAFIEAHSQGPLYNFAVPYQPSNKVSSASTDVGDVSWVCPTVQFDATTMCRQSPGHSWQITTQGKTTYAHKGMFYAAEVIACSVIDLLNDPMLLEKARKEHEKNVGPDGYICPIPKEVKPRPIQ